MLQVIFTTLLIAIIIVPIPLLLLIDRKQKRKALKLLLHRFSHTGSNNGLSFSSQELLRNMVIGLDGLQRKLVVVERKPDDAFQSIVIDLNEVKNCSVNKQCRTVSGRDAARAEQLLESISLNFTLPQQAPVNIVFYNYIVDQAHHAPERESKARYWQAMLSKLQAPQ